jgi:hypothetical protein
MSLEDWRSGIQEIPDVAQQFFDITTWQALSRKNTREPVDLCSLIISKNGY